MKRIRELDRPASIIVVRLRRFLKARVDHFAYRNGNKSINDYVVKAIERQVDHDEAGEASKESSQQQ